MAFDETTISPQARRGYVLKGRSFSSDDTLAQANQTLKAIGSMGPLLARFGFSPGDVQRLTDVRDALEADRVGRGEAAGVRRISRQAVRSAIARGREEREGTRQIVEGAGRDLREAGGPAAQAALVKIDEVLAKTAVAPSRNDAAGLSDQLEHLRLVLIDPAVAAAAATRGGPEAAADLQASIAALRAADHDRPASRGTPAETERLDLLDGIVVVLARSARKAARSAARRLGKPSLAAEFELTCLYGAREGRGAEGDAAPDADTPDADTPDMSASDADRPGAGAPVSAGMR